MGRARWAVAGLALVLVLLVAAPAMANILPVGQWDLNEGTGTVAHNDSPLSGDGTLQGAASWTQGRFESGLSFNGTTGVLDVPDSPALDGAQITVSAWVKSSGSPGDYRYIVIKGGNQCCTGSYGLYTGANGGLEFYVATGLTTFALSPDAGVGVWNGEWHNVVGTFDGSTVRLYVDGQQIGSGTPDNLPIQYDLPSGNDLMIGNYLYCPSVNFGFNGTIDEVKVFNRALGPGEIGLGYFVSRLLPSWSPFDVIL